MVGGTVRPGHHAISRTGNGSIGKRIRLLEVPQDPSPIQAGSEGWVVAIRTVTVGLRSFIQVSVNYDNPNSLAMIPPDGFELIPGCRGRRQRRGQVAEAVRERRPGIPLPLVTGYAAIELPPGSKVIDKPIELTLARRVQAALTRY